MQKDIIERVKAMTSIRSIVGLKVKLKRQSGDRWLGLCPFHKERTSSFIVNDAEGFFHCFGCQIHGDVIEFWQKIENVSFLEAVRELGERVGISVELQHEVEHGVSMHRLWRDVMSETCAFYHSNLEHPTSTFGINATKYLQQRGITTSTIKQFRIGCTSDHARRDALYQYLIAKHYPSRVLLELGLAQDRNGVYRDFFNSRIIIPICDHSGRVIGFGGRVINDSSAPKYLNSVESILFKKRSIVFNLHHAKKQLTHGSGEVIVVEGYMDAIMLQQHGFCGVATLGTAVTEQQISAILGISKAPVICLDNDIAGKRAIIKIVGMLLPLLDIGYKPRFALITETKDTDEILQHQDGKDRLRDIISRAMELQDFIWYILSKRYPLDNPNTKSQLEAAIASYTESIDNRIIRKNYEGFFRQKIYEMTYSRLDSKAKHKPVTERKHLAPHSDSLKMNTRNLEIAILAIIIASPKALSVIQQDDYHVEFIILEEIYYEYVRLLTLQYECDEHGVFDINMSSYSAQEFLEKLSASLVSRKSDIQDIKDYVIKLRKDWWSVEQAAVLYLRKGVIMYNIHQIDNLICDSHDGSLSKDLDFFTRERNRLTGELALLDEEINAASVGKS